MMPEYRSTWENPPGVLPEATIDRASIYSMSTAVAVTVSESFIVAEQVNTV